MNARLLSESSKRSMVPTLPLLVRQTTLHRVSVQNAARAVGGDTWTTVPLLRVVDIRRWLKSAKATIVPHIIPIQAMKDTVQ